MKKKAPKRIRLKGWGSLPQLREQPRFMRFCRSHMGEAAPRRLSITASVPVAVGTIKNNDNKNFF